MELMAAAPMQASPEDLWRLYNDYDWLAEMAAKSGATVAEGPRDADPLDQARWVWDIDFKGINRQVSTVMEHEDRGRLLRSRSRATGFEAELDLLSEPRGTDAQLLTVTLRIQPLNLPARLVLKPLKLAQPKIEEAFARKILRLIEAGEERLAQLRARNA